MRGLPSTTKSFLPTLYRLHLLFWSMCSFMLSQVNAEVSLDFKIGQMLMIGFKGLEVHNQHPVIHDIQQLHLGGVILSDYDVADQTYRRNIESPAQLRQLTERLQQASTIPLLIAIDHEGGTINRLKESYGFPPTVSHQYLGAKNDCATTHKEASTMAKILSEVGFNLNLAPVIDLNVNPDNPIIAQKGRSFSKDPDIVTRHALEFIQAHREQGVLCTAKHFPGHGSSKEDSHLGMVDVSKVWSRAELEPYRALIQNNAIHAIMTAHVFNTELDSDYPATLSHKTITGLLRNELNYKGVVISDDLQMKAITKHYGFEAAIQKSLEAGIDILLITNNSGQYDETVARRAHTTIQQLVTNGTISEARIDQSYQRIQALKSSLGTTKSINSNS